MQEVKSEEWSFSLQNWVGIGLFDKIYIENMQKNSIFAIFGGDFCAQTFCAELKVNGRGVS